MESRRRYTPPGRAPSAHPPLWPIPDLMEPVPATPPPPSPASQPGAHEPSISWMQEQAAVVIVHDAGSVRPTATLAVQPSSSTVQPAPADVQVRMRSESLFQDLTASIMPVGGAAGAIQRRKSTFVSLDSHTPIMSRKRSMRSCMSELEALAAQRRRQVPIIPKHTRSARIDLMAGEKKSGGAERA